MVPQSNLAQRYGQPGGELSNFLGRSAGRLQDLSGFLGGRSEEAMRLADALNRHADAYERMIALLERQEMYQREIARNTGTFSRDLSTGMQHTLNAYTQARVEKEYLDLMSAGAYGHY